MGDPNTGEIYQVRLGESPKPGDVPLTAEQAEQLRAASLAERVRQLHAMAADIRASETHPLEITDDLTTIKVIIGEMVSALSKSETKSRERSLAITKLQEAGMWVREAQARE